MATCNGPYHYDALLHLSFDIFSLVLTAVCTSSSLLTLAQLYLLRRQNPDFIPLGALLTRNAAEYLVKETQHIRLFKTVKCILLTLTTGVQAA